MIKIFNKKALFILIPVLILIVVIFFAGKAKSPIVVSTDPIDNEQDVLETKQISVNFNSDIQENGKIGVSVNFDPQVDFDSTWLVNTYKIIPKKLLKNNTKYTATVLYKNKEIYEFSFTTQVFSQAAIQKYGHQQAADDLLYGQALDQIVKDHPWYPNLPIKTKDYVVYYDFGQEKFAITFLDSTIDQEKKDSFIKEALSKIKDIGGTDPIQYYTQP